MQLHEVCLALSQNFTQDENLISSQERELLTSILAHTRQFANGNSADTDRVERILTHALGETLLQRISHAVGSRVLEEIKAQSESDPILKRTRLTEVASPPPSPHTGPHPPSPSPSPGPGVRVASSLSKPIPYSSSQSSFAETGTTQGNHHPLTVDSSVAVRDSPEILRARYLALEEFLAPEELQTVTSYVLAHEADFRVSEVISPSVAGGVIDPEYRRSRVLMDSGSLGDSLVSRVRAVLPRALEKLGIEPFPISRVECQITASNHGDFFRHHTDNAEEEIATRELTFVYFFHREPKAFHGGELRLYDACQENGSWFSTGNHQVIVPEQNQLILFRSALLHEITPVVCPSLAFADSRFTVNGWLHK
jgi:Rps23 Pro-64 3,4-dihydroxylase Tpa1-like proline 4-hydroxylase